MKRIILLLSIFQLYSLLCAANPGDTTWVQAQKNIQLDYYNDFDTPVSFPNDGKTYGKIMVVFTLGKYECAGSEQYCGDWDYTIQNFLLTSTDTIELARLITPYANASAPRTPFTWQQHYYYDVTDFYPLLKDKQAIRLHYSGYSGGFTGDIKFAFIEGTPARNVLGILPMWRGYFNYGEAANPINNHFPTFSATAPALTQQAAMKFTVTGHGSDKSGCCEFLERYYDVYSQGSVTDHKFIWRDDCGSNELYPQSGTWLYNRSNWCPGDLVAPDIHVIPNVTAGTVTKIGVAFQNYTSTGGNAGGFEVASSLFFYGAFNHTLDASVEDVIAPTNYEGHFRENPDCGSPVIRIGNRGATPVTSVTFSYGVAGQAAQTATISGLSLAPLADTIISLPALTILNSIAAGNYQFQVTITSVNGIADSYAVNNSYQTTFTNIPAWPSRFIMSLTTNRQGKDTKWTISDGGGNIVQQRNPTANNKQYVDTVAGLSPGCYTLTVTDASCNGLYWWAQPYNGTGNIQALNTDGSVIPFSTNLPAYPDTYYADFGCGFTQNFHISDNLLPLTLVSFSGKAAGDVNNLYWQTSNEINTDYFNLEYSTDGQSFATVSKVWAGKNTYSSVHRPAQTAPVYYYRLQMMNTDGTFRYSNVITIVPSLSQNPVQVLPNPFRDHLQINMYSQQSQQGLVSLYDMQGRKVAGKSVSLQAGSNSIQLENLGALSAGSYLLKINTSEGGFEQKVVKQND